MNTTAHETLGAVQTREWEPRHGWLEMAMHNNAVEVAQWTTSARKVAGFTDDTLTEVQRKEAASILRKRADELDGGEWPTPGHKNAGGAE